MDLEDIKINVKIKLALFWVALMFFYLYNDLNCRGISRWIFRRYSIYTRIVVWRSTFNGTTKHYDFSISHLEGKIEPHGKHHCRNIPYCCVGEYLAGTWGSLGVLCNIHGV